MRIRKHILLIAGAALVAGLAYIVLQTGTHPGETAATGARPAAAAPGFVAPSAAPAIEPAALAIPFGELHLEGKAIDADQHPIAGATITLNGSRTIITEADGAFAFDQLAAGDYRVTAEKDTLYAEDTVTVADGSEPTMLKLVPGTTLVLHVVADGAPVPGVEVDVMNRTTRTDRTGTVRYRGVELHQTFAVIHSERYAPFSSMIATGDDPRATVEKTIALVHGAPVAGIIVDQDRRPVPNATLYYRPAGGHSGWVDADAEGRWHIDRVAAGKLVLSASSPVHVATPNTAVRVDGEHPTADVVVRVERGAVVSGVVVDARGKPVAGASVSVASSSAHTDDAGRFEITGIEPGAHDASAVTTTQGSAVEKIQLPPGGRVEIRLVVVESRIAGRVTNPRGEPLPDITVNASSTGDASGSTAVTDAAGKFDLGGLAPGDYQLVAERDGDREHHREPVTVHTGDQRVTLVVADTATLTGRVVLDGRPVDYFGVAVTDDPTSSYSKPDAVRAPDGRFTLAHLPPGRWSVAIVGPAFMRKTIADVTVTEAGTTDLGDILVERGRTISGRVRDERGAPIAGALVTLGASREPNTDAALGPLTTGVRTARSDADGNYRLDGIEPSDGELLIGATDDRGIAAATRADPSATTVDLVIQRTGAISGEVVNERARSSVVATSASGATYYASTDPDHEFVLDHLPPGDYLVGLTGDAITAPVQVMVTGDATASVRLDLSAPIHVTIRVEPPEDCRHVRIEPAVSSDDLRSLLAFLECHDGIAEHPDVAPGHYHVCASFGLCNDIEVTASPPSQLVVLQLPPPDQP